MRQIPAELSLDVNIDSSIASSPCFESKRQQRLDLEKEGFDSGLAAY
jgi:hypothetical protein